MPSLHNALAALAFSWIAVQPTLAINGPNGQSINIPGTPASPVGLFFTYQATSLAANIS
jgi:hypothetical protein